MKKRELSLCAAVAMAVMQFPAFVQGAELSDGDIVWEENFESKAVGYDIKNDTEHWARSEIRGSNNSIYDYSALVAGNEGHKYLKISTSLKEGQTVYTSGNGPTAGVVTKTVSEMGLSENEPFTISYDFKTAVYNAETMAYDGGVTEYYQSISGDSADYSNNVANMTKHMYFYHRAAEGNKTSIYTSTQQASKLTELGLTDRALPNDDIYTAGWNSLQWAVHPSATSKSGYAELYLNGVYAGTVTFRDGSFAETLVLAMYMKPGIENGCLYVDNIKITKGAAEMAQTAKTIVNAITTGFEECENDAQSGTLSVLPDISQAGGEIVLVENGLESDSEFIKFEAAGGAYGKDSSDKALHIEGYANTTGSKIDSRIQMKFNTNVNTKLSNPDDSQEISFDFAYDNVVGPLNITMYLYNEDGTSTKNLNTISLNQSRIAVAGKTFTLGEALKINTWYKLRIVLKKGSDVSDIAVYLTRDDGKTEAYTGQLSQLYRGFEECWIHYQQDTSYNKTKGVWYDNFSIKNYLGGETPETMTAGETIQLTDNGDGTVTANVIVDNAANPDAVLIIAVYDENVDKNAFSDAVIGTAGASTSTYYELDAEISKSEGQIVKAMLWGGFDTVKPLLNVAE